ncbi:MAG TPA: ATP-dependent DNA helicase RecG [Candidatus Baltobacteraceae bacterium]
MTPIDDLSAVGPKTAQYFRELGIDTAEALLENFPFRYEDMRFPTPSTGLGGTQEEQIAVGRIVHVKERRVRDLEIVEACMRDDAGEFWAKWIGRRRFVYGRFREGMRLWVRGRVEKTTIGPSVNVTTYGAMNDDDAYHGELVPIYHASKDLSTRKIGQVVDKNFARLLELIPPDPLPSDLARERRFPELRDGYRAIHKPQTPQEAQLARERFIYTEFLALAISARQRRAAREREHGARALRLPPALLEEFAGAMPFALTGAQRKVVGEIWDDMTRDVPMNRLLQGDVGSGKTLVAAAAIVLAARNGIQSALMAPTEILASQHASKLAPLLLPFGIALEAVFGSQGSRSRKAAIDRLASGEAAVAVGTHALLTEGVDFARLGLVVIDEQHRFGVAHRARLRAKGGTPHTLHMTATPIPRTLAQSVYADLDLSVLDELPPGRTPVETFAIRASRMARVEEFVRANVARGHQTYIVAPAIEESESELTGALAEAQRLKATAFANLQVAVLHGKMPAREKENVMGRFSRGEIDVLVATTVVEVGVDVPNANVMVILDAQRYGLAQLHQLRGRVGRGAAQSFCLLIAPDDAGEIERLDILTGSTDGFYIADEDLRLRGPGEFAGTAQSGVADLLHGDLVRDVDLYRVAKSDADRLIRADPQLQSPEHARLAAFLAAQPSARAMLASS